MSYKANMPTQVNISTFLGGHYPKLSTICKASEGVFSIRKRIIAVRDEHADHYSHCLESLWYSPRRSRLQCQFREWLEDQHLWRLDELQPCHPSWKRSEPRLAILFHTSPSVWPDWAIYWTLGNFSKPVASISLLKTTTLLGNFCKGVEIFNFSSEIIFRELL